MAVINFIFDLGALLLWTNWRALGFREFVPRRGTLVHNLRSAATAKPRRWIYLVMLLGLLIVRGMIYRQIGTGMSWVPHLDLRLLTLPFRSDQPWRTMLFSVASFGLTLAVFYFWLLILSILNRSVPDTQPGQQLVRLHLGRVEGLPWPIKLLLLPALLAIAWSILYPVVAELGMVPSRVAGTLVVQQGILLGLAFLLTAKYLLIGVLLLHVLNSYVYLGSSPFWELVSLTARHLLQPLRILPLRAGRLDFAPFVGLVLVWLLADLDARALSQIFHRLPLFG